MIKEKYKEILKNAANLNSFPVNTPCPNGCKFCYERKMDKLFSGLRVEHIPMHNNESFDYFFKNINPARPIMLKAITSCDHLSVSYWPHCDFFCMGLSLEQIEKIIAHNQKLGSTTMIDSTGLNLDTATMKYLGVKYPDSIFFHFSVITFNDQIKNNIVSNPTNAQKIIKLIRASKFHLHIFLLHFNLKNTINDLKILESLGKETNILISALHYNKTNPEIIKKLSKNSHSSFKKTINYLQNNKKEFKNIDNLRFRGPSGAYAWKNKEKLRSILKPYNFNKNDLILCSRGAYGIIKYITKDKAMVKYIKDSLNGSTDFAVTITAKDIIKNIKPLIKNKTIKRIFVPSSFWWIGNKYDLNGKNLSYLKEKVPEIKIIRLDIPEKMLGGNLSLEECYNYYKILSH